uniref:Cadherin domain-containing protein n=1 Tax=Labrus bergylta TaxID=56723 RepID=A0A3Q3GTY3_9LABR
MFSYFLQLWCSGGSAADSIQLRRHKRDWVVPTRMLKENIDYSERGFVAKIRSDWDEEQTLYYFLLGPGASENPMNLFVVDLESGLVYVKGKLDREERETYILTGVARFHNGSVAEGRIDLRFDVGDENDNPPVFVPMPPATVNESSPAGTLVSKITATDADKANCSHSKITYSLVKQEPFNGTDLFYIDRNTGNIYVKENTLDRETQSSYVLTVTGSDMDGAPGGHTSTGTIDVIVVDINDNKPMLEKDEVSRLIKNVSFCNVVTPFLHRYAKGHDPDSWLLIDPETAEIRLQKAPDRESPFLVNGTYYAKILGLTEDVPPKIVTGTIALQVGDVNDNCPTLTNNVEYICSDTQVVNVTAMDEDGDPNSDPFSFRLLEEKSQGEWRIEPLNATSASLMVLSPLWPGHYQVAFMIQDKQGLACTDPQYLDLHVCSCDKEETCRGLEGRAAFLRTTSSTLGGLGVGMLILGLLTLLIVALLLMTCSCGVSGSFSELPFDTSEHLIVYHTEVSSRPWLCLTSNTHSLLHTDCIGSYIYWTMESRRDVYSAEEQLTWHDSIDDVALSDVFLHDYYSQKASCAAARQAAWDCLLEHNYEGFGSPAGSVSCGSSILECDDDLQFLDDLGPKFKKLAEICSPPRPQTPPKSITIPELKKADVIAETKPDRNQNVSMAHSSSGALGSNRASSSHMHEHKSTSVNEPVFYTTTPVMQPMHYIVQPQLQSSSVLLAEAPVTNLQGMILLNGSPGNMEHILHGRNTAGTLTLGRTTGNAVVEGIRGAGIWQRADGSGEVRSVRKGGRRIRSEGGTRKYQNIILVSDYGALNLHGGLQHKSLQSVNYEVIYVVRYMSTGFLKP